MAGHEKTMHAGLRVSQTAHESDPSTSRQQLFSASLKATVAAMSAPAAAATAAPVKDLAVPMAAAVGTPVVAAAPAKDLKVPVEPPSANTPSVPPVLSQTPVTASQNKPAHVETKSTKPSEVNGAKNLAASAGELQGSTNVRAAVPVALVPATAENAQAEAPSASAREVGTTVPAGAAAMPQTTTTAAVKTPTREGKKTQGDTPAVPKQELGTAVAPVSSTGSKHPPQVNSETSTTSMSVASPTVGVAPVAMGATSAAHAGLSTVGAASIKESIKADAVSQQIAQPAHLADAKALAATPQSLEVGIESGTHGWLRVRAEMGQTGEIAASMVASSAGQADALRRELPAMSTYLAGESVGLSSLVVHAVERGTGAPDSAMSPGAEARGGSDSRAQDNHVTEQGREQRRNDLAGNAGLTEIAAGGAPGLNVAGSQLPSALLANGSGSWLSVRV